IGTSYPNGYSSITQEKSFLFPRADINDSMHDSPFTQSILNTLSECFNNLNQGQIRRPQSDNYNSIAQEATSSRAAVNNQDTMCINFN
ncbi:32005_t:CDS:2, partial [Gigaspora margarita]